MDIEAAKRVMLRTHTASLTIGARASAIELISGPGIGKSSGVSQYCSQLAVEIGEPVGEVVFMLATISSVDVRGFMLPQKGAAPGVLDTVFSTPPWMPVTANTRVHMHDGSVVSRGAWTGSPPRVGVLFLDEFAQADDEVKKAAAELLLHGEVGNAVLPHAWRVVAASNRLSDRSGVLRAMTFIVNRRLELRVDPNLPAWLRWATSQPDATRPHYLSLSFAQKNPDIVFKDSVPDGSDPFCTPRTLCLMDKDLRALRSDDDIARDRLPMDGEAREVAAGWIGGGSAAQYYTHIKYADDLPDIDDVERRPMEAKLPPNKDAQMVTAYMLSHNVTDKNAPNVFKYLTRLNIEMQVLAVRAITNRKVAQAAVVNTIEFTQWLRRNKDLLIAAGA